MFKVEAPKKIEDGLHEGTIIDVEYRDQPFKYTDLVISFGDNQRIKAGYPSFITPVNKLGKLLDTFGAAIEVGNDINPKEILKGKKCTFMTMTSDKGFANVVPGSLKPR